MHLKFLRQHWSGDENHEGKQLVGAAMHRLSRLVEEIKVVIFDTIAALGLNHNFAMYALPSTSCVEKATEEENSVISCRSVQNSRPHLFVSMRGKASPTIAIDEADILHIPLLSTTTRVQEATNVTWA